MKTSTLTAPQYSFESELTEIKQQKLVVAKVYYLFFILDHYSNVPKVFFPHKMYHYFYSM